MLKLSDIEPNKGQIDGLPKNPRFIKDDKFKKLVKSIEDNPEMTAMREILVYPMSNGKYVIIGGNMRYRAMKELKYKEAPCKVIPQEATIEQLKAYTLKDNSGYGEWDFDLLNQEWDLSMLENCAIDLPEIGADALADEAEPQEAQEDDFDETKDDIPARVQKGEVWKLGEHRLMCGDSTDEGCVKTLMGGVLADMVFTDPPYGVSYTEKNEYLNSLGAGHRLTKRIENDDMTPTEMYDFWLKAFKLLHTYTNQRMSYYITAPQGGDLLLLLLQSLRDAGFMLKHQLIWNKNNHVLGRCDYNYKHEPIIYGWKIGGTHSFYGAGKFKTSVWDIPKPLKNDLHPTMKPIELVAECLLDCTQEGNVALDLFGGSGTTLIACEQLNRKCFMMEFDPHYCDVIIARWEKLTGKQAEKVS